VLRRDQIWFTEKQPDGASQLYPLSDFKPRMHENLENGYLQGRYGAIRSSIPAPSSRARMKKKDSLRRRRSFREPLAGS